MSDNGLSIHSRADSDGKGTVGCLFSLVLLIVGVFGGIRTVPLYYSAIGFEADLKTEVSRAGSHFYEDEMIVKDILDLARKNEISVKQEDIRIQRVAAQIFVNVDWNVPVDFMLFEHTFLFNVKASSYVGRL